MIVRTLYLDTSVVGGAFDEEWREPTRELLRQASQGAFRLTTSVVTAREILGAPPEVRQEFSALFKETTQVFELSSEAEFLAQAYLAADVVTPKYADDARHVAIATINGLTLIVSWNFHHLVNVSREAGFNAVNLLHGYSAVRIVSPLEVIHANEDEDL